MYGWAARGLRWSVRPVGCGAGRVGGAGRWMGRQRRQGEDADKVEYDASFLYLGSAMCTLDKKHGFFFFFVCPFLPPLFSPLPRPVCLVSSLLIIIGTSQDEV